MIYEMRRYQAVAGRLKDLHELMDTLAVPVFKKCGMTVVGCWTPVVGDDESTLIYMLSYENMGAREKAWNEFWTHPDWVKGRAEFAKKVGGPVVDRSNSVFLAPTAYSALT